MGDVAEERQLSVTIKKERTYENNKVTNVRVIVTPTVDGENFENDFICNSEEWIKLNDAQGSVYKDFTSNVSNYEISLQYVSEETLAYWYQYDGTVDITEIGLELYEPIGWEKPKKIKDGYVTLNDGQELSVTPAKYEGKTPVNVTNLEKMDNAIAYLFEHGIFNGGSSLQEETNSLKIKELQSKVDNQEVDIENIEVKNTEQDDLITQLENKTIELQNKNNEQQELITELETEVNELKDNVLTNEVEGTNIYVEDSANARVLELDIDGNSYQEVRSGKNLLKLTSSSKECNLNGVTITIADDGLITLNGTSTGDSWPDLIWNIKENTAVHETCKYYFDKSLNSVTGSCKIVSGTSSVPLYISIVLNDESNSIISLKTNSKLSETKTDNVLGINRTYISISKDAVFDNFSFYLQLEEGDTVTEYEPFGASPSPDYPSEIEVVKGYNLFDEITTNELVSTDGVILSNASWSLSDFIEVEPNENYTLNHNDTVSTRQSLMISEYDENKVFIKRNVQGETSGNAKYTITTSATTKYVRINYNNTFNNDLFQFIKGTTPKPYVPYKNIGIRIPGKNLFDKDKTPDNFYYNNSGGTTTDGTNKFINQKIIAKSNKYAMSYKNKIENSIVSAYVRIAEYKSDNTFIKRTLYSARDAIIALDTNTNYFIICVDNGPNAYFEELQIEQSSVATSYEPYQENITYIDLQDNEICKVGDIKDELDLNTGILTKRIGKVVLDGNDGWYKSSIANIDRYGIDLNTLNITNFEGIQMVCNYFKYTTNQIVMKGTFKIINNHLYIDFAESGTSTLDEFKTWLSENPVTVYYQLATPYEVNLGKIEMLKTINHVTNINLLSTLETNMKLKYVRSTNVVIDNLAKAIVALGGEV